MIYLSGAMQAQKIGMRPDIGIMTSYRKKGLRVFRKHFVKTFWAADNGCFNNPNLDVDRYLAWLEKNRTGLSNCLFATAPDVVGNAAATLERSAPALPLIRSIGYKAAFVAQDGIEKLSIDWSSFDCLFIGGSKRTLDDGTEIEWKLSLQAFELIAEAKRRGKWVHMGRVNSLKRLRIAHDAGCDSADGTQLAFAPDLRYEQMCRWLDKINARLNFQQEAA